MVIGNLMDNAIEASEKLPREERQIHVKAILEDDFFFPSAIERGLCIYIIIWLQLQRAIRYCMGMA